MAEPQYTSTLTGPELDAALRDAESVGTKVQQAQSAAQQAAHSASSAQGYASAAGSSASAASTAAGTATSKAQDAQTAAEQAADSATQAAQSAASIASSVSAAQSAAEDAESAAQEAQAAQTAAEDAAERAAAAADFDPADFATAAQGAKADTSVQSVNGVTPDPEGDVQIETGGDPLIGDTSEVTPAQVISAINGGRPVAITYNASLVTFNAGVTIANQYVYLMFAGGDSSPYTLFTLMGIAGSGEWIYTENAFGKELPAVTEADNGKFLRVAGGVWAAEAVPSAEEASF